MRNKFKYIMLCLLSVAINASAFSVAITPGAKAIYLQVGAGTMTGAANYQAGAIPGNNTTINLVSTTIPTASVGNGVAQVMATNSPVISTWDSYAFCNAPNQVYIAGFNRRPSGGTGTAALSVTAPVSLTTTAGDAIPFNKISWTSTGNGDPTPSNIPAGTFVGGSAQNMYTFAVNNWSESCHTFTYLNNTVVAGGIYNGRVTYSLVTP